MAQDQDWEDEYDDTAQLIEEPEEEGRWPTIVSRAMRHPRITLGGGSLLLSFAVDVAIRFDPFAVVIGLATAVAIGWNGDALARGMPFLIPGLDQEQVREDADRFAATLVEDAPVYADQSIGAKLRRLFSGEKGEVVDALPQNRERAKRSRLYREEGLTLSRVATWLEEGRINDKLFFVLLQRIDEGSLPTHRHGYGNDTKDEHNLASEDAVSPQMEPLRPPGWDSEKIQQLIGAFRATNHLDNSLKALDLSTSQRNRDVAREILKQQGLWKEK